MPTDPITTTGDVLHVFSENAFKIALPNGKEIIGHPSKEMVPEIDDIVPGVRVLLEMTPFDFEKGRIVGLESPNS